MGLGGWFEMDRWAHVGREALGLRSDRRRRRAARLRVAFTAYWGPAFFRFAVAGFTSCRFLPGWGPEDGRGAPGGRELFDPMRTTLRRVEDRLCVALTPYWGPGCFRFAVEGDLFAFIFFRPWDRKTDVERPEAGGSSIR